MVLCLGEAPGRFLFVVVPSFLFFILLLFFIHFFSTSSLTLLWTIAGFLYPFYTFSPAHHRVICGTFILTFRGSSFTVLPRALRFWVEISLPTKLFLSYAPSPTFLTQSAFNKASLGAGSFSLKFAGLYTDPSVFVWFTVIHNF